ESIGLDIDNKMISQKGPLAIGTMQDIAVILAHHLYLKAVPWNEAVQLVQNSFTKVHETIHREELLQLLHVLINLLNNVSVIIHRRNIHSNDCAGETFEIMLPSDDSPQEIFKYTDDQDTTPPYVTENSIASIVKEKTTHASLTIA